MGHSDKVTRLTEDLVQIDLARREAVPLPAGGETTPSSPPPPKSKTYRIKGEVTVEVYPDDEDAEVSLSDVATVLRRRGVSMELFDDEGEVVHEYATFFADDGAEFEEVTG